MTLLFFITNNLKSVKALEIKFISNSITLDFCDFKKTVNLHAQERWVFCFFHGVSGNCRTH